MLLRAPNTCNLWGYESVEKRVSRTGEAVGCKPYSRQQSRPCNSFSVPEGFSSETKNLMWSSLMKLARRWKLNVHLQLPPTIKSSNLHPSPEISNFKLHEYEPNQNLKLETTLFDSLLTLHGPTAQGIFISLLISQSATITAHRNFIRPSASAAHCLGCNVVSSARH